jgi:hypothetical protein
MKRVPPGVGKTYTFLPGGFFLFVMGGDGIGDGSLFLLSFSM